MAAAVAFQATLERIGFNHQSVEALEANGIDGVRDLINLSDKDVEQILKIIRTGPPPLAVPYLAQK
jgi:DNA-directed RNA polymerase alpha subunit